MHGSNAHERGELGVPRRASVEVLRVEARQELRSVIEERLLAGEDPWDFMEEIPSVDELVVLGIRAEMITTDGGRIPDRAVDYRMLRQIASAYPELTSTVWALLDDERTSRRVRADR